MLRADGPIHMARLTLRPFGPGNLDDLCGYQSRRRVKMIESAEAARTRSRHP